MTSKYFFKKLLTRREELTILKSKDIIENIYPVKFRRKRTSKAGFNWT